MTTYYQQENYWRLHELSIYEWNVRYSLDFRNGYDGEFKVRATVQELLNNVVSFIVSHLKYEKVIVTVWNENNEQEVEAIISRDIIVYVNGLAEFVKGKDVAKY